MGRGRTIDTSLMDTTICICTRNRAGSLKRALESLSRQNDCEEIEWDVLVVDNGSIDRTADTARAFSDLLNIRVAHEPIAGVALARNTALRLARGAFIVFIDDDVTVPSQWLAAYVRGFASYPEAAFFGGPIIARVKAVSPRRLAAIREAIPGALSWLEPDLAECQLTKDSSTLPWGANMAFRRSAIEGHMFDVRLGRKPGRSIDSGEESVFFKNLLDSGSEGAWLPKVWVEHHVSHRRCSRSYLRRHCHGIGWYLGYQAALEQAEEPASALKRLKSTISERRLRYWRSVGSGSPLVQRLSALRDLTIMEGFRDGFTETPAAKS